MASRNIFDAGAVEITELLTDYIEGQASPGACIALTISAHPANEAVRNAVEKSLAALEFGEDCTTYATIFPNGDASAPGDIPLDGQMLFMLVEGLDPLCVVAADATSAHLLAQAYRTSFPADAAVRVFGRPAAVFDDLDSLLQTSAGKQKAWSLFKSLTASA